MENTFFITEENLIGTLANAILELKNVKEQKQGANLTAFNDLINFLQTASDQTYKELLYDKHFIISPEILQNLHKELTASEIRNKIGFSNIKKMLMSINQDTANSTLIENAMDEIKKIVLILMQMKNNIQNYM